MSADSKVTAARAFVRSLNILLKLTRLYGFDHDRAKKQFATAWDELRAAMPHGSETGLLLGSANGQLLLDGIPLGGSPVERSFAQLLTAAGVASLAFTPRVTQDELSRFVCGFPAGGAKPSDLAAQLKASLSGATGIRVNEIRFVAEDPAFSDVRTAAQLTASALGAGSDELKNWLTDPQKLLQLIAAAQGANAGPSGHTGAGTGGEGYSGEPLADIVRESPGGGVESSSVNASSQPPTAAPKPPNSISSLLARPSSPASQAVGEDDLLGILKVLTQLGSQIGDASATPAGTLGLQRQLTDMPASNQELLRQALASFAAKAPSAKPDRTMLIQLAEHLAIRFALDRYERGEVKVNAVRQTLERMNKEIDSLRAILGQHEDKMAKAGMEVESHADVLDRQFWASVPEKGKRSVLLSEDAWCIPARNVRSFCKELESRGETSVASNILARYAACIHSPEGEARRRTAMGMAELADLYAGDTKALIAVIRLMGMQMTVERDPEIQTHVTAAFVRLSQEAAALHCYPAIQQALISLEGLENQRPTAALEIRPRLGIEERFPEFIEAVIRANKSVEDSPEGLADVLRMLPHAAIAQILTRFNRAGQRAANDRFVMIAREIGPEAVTHLKESVRIAAPQDAAEAVGLLSRLEPESVEQWLAGRIVEWPLAAQDRCIRVLASAGAPERGALLLGIFGSLDPLAKTLALDEMGMSGDASSGLTDIVSRLMQIAETEIHEPGAEFLRLKAIEALGRLRAVSASNILQRVVQQKHNWLRTSVDELRIAALQSLAKIDSGVAETTLPHAALEGWQVSFPALDAVADSQWYRQRRYQRLRIAPPLPALATSSSESARMEIKGLSLSGGMAACDRHILPGTLITIKIKLGMRGIVAQALMRDVRTHGVGFEIVSMTLEDRSRLRRLLFSHLRPEIKPPSKSLPDQQSPLIPKKMIV